MYGLERRRSVEAYINVNSTRLTAEVFAGICVVLLIDKR